ARKVKNRVDRIIESSRFLQEINNTNVYPRFTGKTTGTRGFKTDAIRFLFPERGGFKTLEAHRSLPGVYYENKENFQEKKAWGNDLWWRTDYTRAVFPEHLWQLRDTGTLWRDFEEAPLLFYSLYNLKYFFDVLLKDKQFIKIK
ncbi:MAG: hypothetical protein JXJ04_15555, partial [Spirochaetales bacterium]|nr:hypothetical protein [Spirochaetales bacterium]